jgi:hypothetical protein
MNYPFTTKILEVLKNHFPDDYMEIFNSSEILKYINLKTRSANKGSKSRGSFANLYAIYVLLEDYINKGFANKSGYSEYEGAKFTDLFTRQRELPFGAKLQNHALNHRMNEEFKKFFPLCQLIPIIRVAETNRYWFNENLINLQLKDRFFNISNAILDIINSYIDAKRDSFDRFIAKCEELKSLNDKSVTETIDFVLSLLSPYIDARLFEIVSFAILKYYYSDQTVYFGFDMDSITSESLKLFKTGRTNANDGGIDFVMKPLGRFFQVTETTDVRKYFLDIDKLEKFPITFVVKSDNSQDNLFLKLKENAVKQYSIRAVVNKYMSCIEEIINIQTLSERFKEAVDLGYLDNILSEIILQSKVEFNYDFDSEDDNDSTNDNGNETDIFQ